LLKYKTLVALNRVQQLSAQLVDSLEASEASDSPRVQQTFEELATLIEALPPSIVDLGELSYFRNRLPGSRTLWEDGERGAALYQMRELHRKLLRLTENARA
jgi:hypothetical protein